MRPRPRLDLPDDLELFAEAVVLDGRQRDEVLWLNEHRVERIWRKARALDVGHDPLSAPDLDELTGFRYGS